MKYQLKLIKISKTERNILIILTFLCLVIYAITIFIKKDMLISITQSPVCDNDVLGKLIKKTNIDGTYINVIYEKDNVQKNYIQNIKNNKILLPLDLVKSKTAFNEKVYALLLLKYPRKIAEILHNKCNKEYFFKTNELLISYEKSADLQDYKQHFSLTINYNEIEKYLIIKPILDETYFNENGYNYDADKTTIAFSFDDGPNGYKTTQILEMLEDYKMSATFFMLGNKMSKQSDVIKKVYESHSEIGYHSYDHSYFTKQTNETIQNDFVKTNNIYKNITSDTLKLTRPPYGSANKRIYSSLDTAFIKWSVDTLDWKYKDSNFLKQYVLENFDDGDIILFHDSYETTVKAIELLTEELYKNNIQVVNVSTLAQLKGLEIKDHELYTNFKNR